MADNSSPDYKLRSKQLEERLKQLEERQKQVEELIRPTTFVEFLRHSHNLLSRPLRVETPSRSTTGKIPLPTGKYCPIRLEPWSGCSTELSELYRSVSGYLQLTPEGALRLFKSLDQLEGLGREYSITPISSERDLEAYERSAVETHVRDIISELCKIPAARDEFGLGDAIEFRNHTNSLNQNEPIEADASQPSSIRRPRPDQYCIHRVDGTTSTVLTTVEYKPPYKLPVVALRMGLRPMDLWEEMVSKNKIETEQEAKLKYNAERLVCSVLVQEYHVMIQEGLEYSYVTNGIARVLLRVPPDDPGTLYYFLCEPNSELGPEVEDSSQLQKTSVARTLCLCLMAFRSTVRGQEWRNSTRPDLPIWKTSFDHTRSQIPREDMERLHSSSTHPEYWSPKSGSPYDPPSSPPGSPPAATRRTRSQAGCAPSDVSRRSQSPDSSGSDSNQATSRKRGLSQVASSPSTQQAARRRDRGNDQGNQTRHRNAQFCTQRCLLGLQSGGVLDDCCPNVMLHRRTKDDLRHPITSGDLLGLLKAQLDENIDRCIPLGGCGGYGAPFKLTCIEYGYTVIGKGTTSGLWKEVSGEAQIYQILRKVQGSAVPVFLGTIDLAKIYFLHGAGEIRHMLVMGWGGQSTASMELAPWLRHEIRKSNREIKALGIIHDDLSRDNILWNEELGRALIIDFHRSTLKCLPTLQRSVKRRLFPEAEDPKRLRVT
ncbi:uncharacterized protein N7515_005326 [Penicillium bovifimosum]|uniref:Protein kinase domain-containing protein n=1 Tax=Penicillium bovifimosum TaxID=126998 RepID=A0A9W9L033_9EURO|nr:uncharacterized protein N7515_005326 [Penicillium bovifimosum]KAJ5129287.1 hypothetical protein N7515_005326 [Penicillium bovifimosum]